MKCKFCKMAGEFICPCSLTILCPGHLSSHLREPNQDEIIELLDTVLSVTDSLKLKNEAISRIEQLKTKKKEIFFLSKSLIIKIESCRQESFKKIDSEVQFYLKLMSLEKLSKSLKAKVDTILITDLKIMKGNLDKKDMIEEAFFFKIAEDHSEIKRNKKAEEKFWKKIKEIESKEIQEKSNQLNVKLEIMYPLNLQLFEASFGGEKRVRVREILFSNDKKFSFICKNYIGIIK